MRRTDWQEFLTATRNATLVGANVTIFPCFTACQVCINAREERGKPHEAPAKL